MSNYDKFWTTYREALAKSIEADPGRFRITDADELVARMMQASVGKCDINTPSFRTACKALGIKHNYKAIQEFIG